MKDLLSWQLFLLFAGMLAVTYSTRLIGFFALRNRTLSRRAQIDGRPTRRPCARSAAPSIGPAVRPY